MTNPSDLVETLDSRGYFDLTPPKAKAGAKNQLASTIREHRQFTAEFDAEGRALDQRCFHTDAEDLMEGLAPSIDLMTPTLKAFGVSIQSVADEDIDEFGLATVVDGEQFVVYEWPNQEPEDLDTWNLSHKRLVEIVNTLLERARSRERLYAIAGYNDAQVVFLTEEMYQSLIDHWEMFEPEFFPRPASAMTEHPQW